MRRCDLAERPLVRVPNYPEILLKRRHVSDEKTLRQCVELLGMHYGLVPPFGSFADSSIRPEDRAYRWCALAISLARDLVPAFRTRRARRNKLDTDAHGDWIRAGGGLIASFDATAFYQAQFVEVIAAKEAEMKKSRFWVFRWFANEAATTTRQEAAKRLESLPRPYRKRTTSDSLKEAFQRIPKEVRRNPKDYLPKPLHSDVDFLSASARSKGWL